MAMNWDEAIKLGHELPDVEVSTSYGTPALKVRGKLLTRLRPELDSVVLFSVPVEEREALIAAGRTCSTPHCTMMAIPPSWRACRRWSLTRCGISSNGGGALSRPSVP